MIWIVGLLMAFVFIKLRMLIIMVKLLAIALQLALLALAVLAIVFLWRKLIVPKLKTYKAWQPEKFISKGDRV